MPSSSSSSPDISTAIESQDRFSYKHATHDEVLEDLSSRFILNLPDEELASLERICFQVEQAHWFYEDFIREENPKFPSLPLKKFSAMLFHACPLLHHWSHDHEQAFNTFMQYKTRVPVCGAIMLNDTWEKCILVKGWKSSSGWGFPKGKINEDEPPASCAVREVLEETGYNLAGRIDPQNVIEMSIKEQKISLFIVPGIPEDYEFKTKTRKEISKIEWFRLTDLPTWKRNKTAAGRFYLISPFIGALKTFINQHKPRDVPRKVSQKKKPMHTPQSRHENSPYPTYNEVNQESGSQSSSAENGEPHTPSPHCTELLANSGPQVVVVDSIKPDPTVSATDPHLARLLSSLAMSLPPVKPHTHDKPSKTVITPSPTNRGACEELNTPVPATIQSRRSHALADQADWSASAPDRPSPRTVKSPPTEHAIHQHSSAPSPVEIPNSLKPLSCSEQDCSQCTQPHPYSPSPLSDVAIPVVNTAVSSQPAVVTGINPYLSQPTEVHSSSKMLKQIALLEAVADESARMSPFFAHQPAAPSLPINNMDRGATHYIPSSFIPSPLMPLTSRGIHMLYNPGPSTPPISMDTKPTVFDDSPNMHDPFYIRSKTSHTYHRGASSPLGSLSMNQSQLLALMNGPRATSQLSNIHPRPPQVRGTRPAPIHRPLPNGIIPPTAQYSPLPYSSIPYSSHMNRSPLPINSSEASAPLMRTSHPNVHSLLSILNNRGDSEGSPPVLPPQTLNSRA